MRVYNKDTHKMEMKYSDQVISIYTYICTCIYMFYHTHLYTNIKTWPLFSLHIEMDVHHRSESTKT
jgi:hypothetical protein